MAILRFLLSAALLCCLSLGLHTGALAAEADNRINVGASASLEAEPDMAYVYFTADGRGQDAAAAAAAAAVRLDAAKRALLGLNITGEELAVQSYRTGPRYDARGRRDGYATECAVKVTVKDINRVGSVIDKITAAGIDTVGGVAFTLSNQELYRSRLLIQAVNNARQQAAAVAGAGGRTLGTLLHASISSYSPVARSVNRALYKAESTGAAADTALDAGPLTLSVSVQTCFALL